MLGTNNGTQEFERMEIKCSPFTEHVDADSTQRVGRWSGLLIRTCIITLTTQTTLQHRYKVCKCSWKVIMRPCSVDHDDDLWFPS